MDQLIDIQNSRTMHFQYIFNLLQQFKNFIKFYDIRDESAFQANHLKIAIHIHPDTFSQDSNNFSYIIHEKGLTRLRRFCIILAYDRQHNQIAKWLREQFHELKCKELHMLGHIEEFMQRYYFLSCNFKILQTLDFPNEIIPEFLYLGNQKHAVNADVVELLRITHILNVTKSSPCAFAEIKYCRVYVEDNEKEKISLFFQKAFEFIDSALDENMKGAKNAVLVHCAQGISRSATIVIMFLMRSTHLSVDEAKEYVKRQRDIIEPNEGFLNELREFEKRQKKFHRRSTDLIGPYNPSLAIVEEETINLQQCYASCTSKSLEMDDFIIS